MAVVSPEPEDNERHTIPADSQRGHAGMIHRRPEEDGRGGAPMASPSIAAAGAGGGDPVRQAGRG